MHTPFGGRSGVWRLFSRTGHTPCAVASIPSIHPSLERMPWTRPQNLRIHQTRPFQTDRIDAFTQRIYRKHWNTDRGGQIRGTCLQCTSLCWYSFSDTNLLSRATSSFVETQKINKTRNVCAQTRIWPPMRTRWFPQSSCFARGYVHYRRRWLPNPPS